MYKNNSKNPKLTKQIKNYLIGGKYLGSGSYGCVVTPPLPCKSSHLSKKTFKYISNKYISNKSKTKPKHSNTKNDRNTTKYVSKIIKHSDEDTFHEIHISKRIKQIDPEQHYFITYESVCKIKKVPSNRNNTEHIEYRNDSLKKYDVLDEYGNIKSSGYNHSNNAHNSNNNNDNHNRNRNHNYNYNHYHKRTSIYNSYNRHNSKTNKCLIDTRLDPINIILPYGGYDLIDLKNNSDDMIKEYKQTKSLQSHLFIKTYTSIFNNFKLYFKNLVIGLYKLHKARIVNCDIKPENIMANYNTKTNKVDMRFIDFGFSEHLTESYCKKYDNIKLFGTTVYLSPDIFIADILNRYIKSGNIKKIKTKISERINENVKEMYDDLKAYDYMNMLYKPYETYETHDKKHISIKHIPIIEEVYNDILHHFENKTILDAYFGTNNNNKTKSKSKSKSKTSILDGYLQKADIYALGCSMYEFLTLDSTIIDVPKNIKLQHLLKKMIHPDPKKRYNSLECLKHSYFK